MKKESQAGADANQEPGMTSQTGTNVLHRTVINSPPGESKIRGVVTLEDLREDHHHNMAAIPFELYRKVYENLGVVFIGE